MQWLHSITGSMLYSRRGDGNRQIVKFISTVILQQACTSAAISLRFCLHEDSPFEQLKKIFRGSWEGRQHWLRSRFPRDLAWLGRSGQQSESSKGALFISLLGSCAPSVPFTSHVDLDHCDVVTSTTATAEHVRPLICIIALVFRVEDCVLCKFLVLWMFEGSCVGVSSQVPQNPPSEGRFPRCKATSTRCKPPPQLPPKAGG